MSTRMLPFPYKFLVIKNDPKDWDRAHISIFDHGENPYIPGSDGSIRDLVYYSAPSLRKIESVLQDINSAEEVKAAGCKYCIFRCFKWEDKWDHRGIVLKLVNSNIASRDVVEQKP
ncbi:hypothetical protein ABW19_dt0207745 [Dactylella cylindrospora]|nr:hypothetical protein ABW19_dt0207745 [Dactylella cylindrospora]